VDAIWAARSNPSSANIYGEVGGGKSNLLEPLKKPNLAAIENPKGSGVIVSVVYAGDGAFASDTAHRSGWLVMDSAIYPIDVEGARAFELLWDGYPEDVRIAAGLGGAHSDFESYGMKEFVSYNADTRANYALFLQEANHLCQAVTPFGT